MFDYVIDSNQNRRRRNRIELFFVGSCLLHFLMIAALIEYPQLLRGGMYHRFSPLAWLSDSLTPKPKDDSENWRTVAVLKPQSKMMAPSAATLKRYLYDWDKKRTGNEAPPIRIRFGDEQKAAINNLPPVPRIREEPKLPRISAPANESAAAATSGLQQEGALESLAKMRVDPAQGRKESIIMPAPQPPPDSGTAGKTSPSSIPKGVKQPPGALPDPSGGLKIFESEQKAIHSPDSGLFDTKGFPLGEYVNIIKERIKGNWFIPSNLQNFQGHTTIVFYIDKDGRYTNARIVTKSGSNSFDNAALMAVITSDPFPPLPEGFPGNHIGAKFVLSWNEP
ncbi:MAG: TonB C-terminal domain-containing protein [Acidobacteria bacterium]|nr:TonB C-terminal domain-containing protein [Acidobacteriota bacterium]